MSITLHYCGTERFARTRSDKAYVELEQSPAVYWGKDLLNAVLAVFSIGTGVAILMVVL